MLPSYEDIHEILRRETVETLPVPTARPTRKGLGRYAYRCYLNDFGDVDETRHWGNIYLACSDAYDLMLKCGVRLPHDTFKYERVLVEHLILQEPRPEGRTPFASAARVHRDKALRWARS